MSDIAAFEGTHGSPVEPADRTPLTYEGTDASVEAVRGTAIRRDQGGEYHPSDAFTIAHAESVPTWERATTEWTGTPTIVGQNPVTLVGRRRGRRAVNLWVPTAYVTTTAGAFTVLGVQIARSPSELAANSGLQLNPGDSITLGTEAPVYVQALPGQTSGVVFFTELYNDLGGPLTP